ncbi:sugar kinase [Marinitenerispora sediminis]|uniref:Sugar kinase n=1 Tax=Marinitenerispora sediminis TaxID=1931232 RepID=A0A368TAR9_9ACTN|nr:sugar kinase [Marinitenerispora sediminis]RCV56993.1 sugar kinase [Marinitenerispora sediminis]RCV60198.1 sugar kinase [Marinitenerispora sediminis]RCV62095.1 sugar kinase [Marinitenerispora sediminis]
MVVIGDLMTDAVARAFHPLARGSDTPASVIMYGGGSGANVAAWLAIEGTDTALVGRRGSDITGRTREMELMGYGIDARMVMDPERPTGTCVVMITHRGDRTMLSDPGANAALQPEDLPRDVFGPDGHLHMSGYTLVNEGSRRAARVALRMARESGMSISVDCGSHAPLERAGAESFLDWTNGARLLFANTEQAAVLTGREEAEAAARVLTAWYPNVVIKLGDAGALWASKSRDEIVVVPAEPVEPSPGSIGAGDAFIAGFLPPWLAGHHPKEALANAHRLAARALHQPGARPDLSD